MKCPRCGIDFVRLYLHREKCKSLPTPAEMACRFRNDETMTVQSFCIEYDTGNTIMKERLMAGGVSAREIDKRARGVQSQNNRRASRQQYQRGKRVCAGCEVLLDHPKVPDGDGKECGWCIQEKERELQVATYHK